MPVDGGGVPGGHQSADEVEDACAQSQPYGRCEILRSKSCVHAQNRDPDGERRHGSHHHREAYGRPGVPDMPGADGRY